VYLIYNDLASSVILRREISMVFQGVIMINASKSHAITFSLVAPFALLLLMGSANLYAQQPVSILLKGDAEVPPVTTSAMGKGKITVMPDHTVKGSIKTSGIVPTMAHIHEAAAGENGPVIIPLAQAANGSFTVPLDAKLTDAQYLSYMAGNLYVNVHSAQYPDGEIRAQLFHTKKAGKPMLIAK
jgi:hypothetical protein